MPRPRHTNRQQRDQGNPAQPGVLSASPGMSAPDGGSQPAASYTVYVFDNFHFMDEEERYLLGVFDTADAALAAAKDVVDDYLSDIDPIEKTVEEAFRIWSAFGNYPLIVPPPPVPFQARDYTFHRCEEIFSGRSD